MYIYLLDVLFLMLTVHSYVAPTLNKFIYFIYLFRLVISVGLNRTLIDAVKNLIHTQLFLFTYKQ